MRYGLSLLATGTGYRSRRRMAASRVIGVDLGGTKLLTGVIDEEGVVVDRTVRPTEIGSQEQLLAELESSIEGLLQDGIGAIGVGIPSTIDQREGRAVASVNIPLAGIDFREHLATRFRLPAAIENDANAAALAEHRFGAGRGAPPTIILP